MLLELSIIIFIHSNQLKSVREIDVTIVIRK